jgi:hypothetical protein
MRYVVAAVAVMVLVISGLGVAAPEQLVAVVASWPPDTRLAAAVGTRLVLGVVFLLGASSCRFPAVISGIGILALAAALLLVLLGEPRLDTLIAWWSQLPTLAIRAWCALGVLMGALILYSALPPTRRQGLL